jgi:hypothetical protein
VSEVAEPIVDPPEPLANVVVTAGMPENAIPSLAF